MKWSRIIGAIAAALATSLAQPALATSPIGGCRFDAVKLDFAGTPAEQAVCLLRKVKSKGSGAVAQPVPPWLLERIGKPVAVTVQQVQKYLDDQQISSSDVGGPLALGDAPQRRFFVIHDTSWPELPDAAEFPPEIDQPNHWTNKLSGWPSVSRMVNLIISRDGRSRTFQDWAAVRPASATKVEVKANRARPLFVHVENIQVRMKPPGSWAWRAPNPGLGARQEQRLALAYLVASLRAGHWLIPAYHFNIDQGIPDGHDDPQNADLKSWVARIEEIEQQIAGFVGEELGWWESTRPSRLEVCTA